MDNKVKVPSISNKIDVIDLVTSSEDESKSKPSIKSKVTPDNTLEPNSVTAEKPIKKRLRIKQSLLHPNTRQSLILEKN